MWDKKGDNLTRKWLYFLTEQQEKEKKVAKAVQDLVGKCIAGAVRATVKRKRRVSDG
jgi:hypothetical protein